MSPSKPHQMLPQSWTKCIDNAGILWKGRSPKKAAAEGWDAQRQTYWAALTARR